MNNFKNQFVNFIHNKHPLIIAGILVIGLWFPVGYFHELGHVLVCVSNGFEYTVFNAGLDLVTDCSNLPLPTWLYWSLGGIFGVIISITPLSVKKIREVKGLMLGFLLLATAQSINGLSETFLHTWYMGSNSNQLLILIGTPPILFLVLKFGLPKKLIRK